MTNSTPHRRQSSRPCAIESCERTVHGRDLCLMHYKRQRNAERNPHKTPIEKFNDHVARTDGCWLWRGPLDQDGYGCLWAVISGQRIQRAHRAAWALFRGPIPPGLMVRHHCDNPSCCNPDHLALGDVRQNSDDKVSRNRQAKGSTLPQTRLSNEQVREIRSLYRVVKGKSNATELSESYGVSRGYLMHLVSRRGQERAA